MKKFIRNTDIIPMRSATICYIALVFLLTVYAPTEIYSGNVDEFIFDYLDIIRVMIPVFVAVAMVGTLLVIAVCAIDNSGKVLRYVIVPFLPAIFLALMIQGTFLSKTLGIIDGSEYKWDLFGS